MMDALVTLASTLGVGGVIAWWLNHRLTSAQADSAEFDNEKAIRDDAAEQSRARIEAEKKLLALMWDKADEAKAHDSALAALHASFTKETDRLHAEMVKRDIAWQAKCDELSTRIASLEAERGVLIARIAALEAR